MIAGLAICAALPGWLLADEMTPEQAEFFESQVRPLLAEHCYRCHSAKAKVLQGGLRLDSRQAALAGGDSGQAIVPGKPEASNLIQAIRWQTSEMPPTGKLSDNQVAVLVKWVELGAPWPGEADEQPIAAGKTYDWPALRKAHWAWQPISDPALPAVRDRAWPKREVDYFVLARLEAAGLTPNRPAEPRVLLRRLCIDLTGLPPTPEEADRFERAVARDRDAAVTQLVDRLLASPAYGERWGRHWLDVARYSDGHGSFLDSAALPNAWRYRDWVVAALNHDLPYDEFVRRQVAGDLLGNEHSVATGFLALGPTYISDGGDLEAISQAKSETLDDRVDTLTRGLLALTVACARCHDHRFDPYPQVDYYSLAGVFNNTTVDEMPLAPPEIVKAYNETKKQIDKLEKERKAIKFRARNAANRKLTADEQRRMKELTAEIDQLKSKAPDKYPFVHTLADRGSEDMHVAIRGNLQRPGPVAPRRFLHIIAGDDPPPFTRGSGRLDLADALVSPQNPLTARVMVNRVWQQYFGTGLVRTASNFGTLGEKPSHPELLDWLAARFRGTSAGDYGWSLKQLHRAIVLSATYQMSSAADERALAVDGDNRLLWRMSPRRLDVEAWRDALLKATGELDPALGGPSISDIGGSRRRTLYAAVSRNGDEFSSDTFLRLFDFPVPRATSEGRAASIVPQQSLFMMNSSFMAARAKALSTRLASEASDQPARIRRAYLLLYGRPATAEELELGLAFLDSPPADDDRLSVWEQYAQVLLSASELMYLE
jgi:mono/diheme cytochrome c family protein